MQTAPLDQFLTILGRSSLEASIVIILVLAAQWLFRKHLSPRWRCALWLLVVVRMILLFSLGSDTSIFNLLPHHLESSSPKPFAFPAQNIPGEMSRNLPLPAQNHLVKPDSRPRSASIPSSFNPAYITPPATTNETTWSWPMMIFAVWLAGVMLLTGHILISSLRLWQRCSRLKPLIQAGALDSLNDCCQRLGVRRKPILLESMEVSSPALVGLFRPCLLLPRGFTSGFSPEELRFVFLHELAHVKRRDLLMNWVVALLQVMHWFNPLVWFGFARWRADRELACDAMALEAAGAGHNKEYGRTILRLLENFTHPLATPGLVGILEDKRQLRQRIGMIASYVPAKGWPRLAFLLAAVLAVISLTDAQTVAPLSGERRTEPTPTALPQKENDMTITTLTNRLARAATIGLLALASPETPILHAADTAMTAAAPATETALSGAWVLVGAPGHESKPPSEGARIKIFAGNHWCMVQAEPKTGIILFHHGGVYTLDGTAYHETVQFAGPTTIRSLGATNGHFNVTVNGDKFTSIGVDNQWKEVWVRLKPDSATEDSALANNVIGTWMLSHKTTPASTAEPDTKRLKICTGGQWCDLSIDSRTGIIVMQHGGTYKIKGGVYSETVKYGDPVTIELIGNTFKYDLKADGQTLGLSGIKNPWKENWTRAE